MNLIFLGPPGCGKGTQALALREKAKIPPISTGQILREARDQKTPLGNRVKKSMESGRLVPDDVVIGIIRERLKKDDCNQGYILDGFPRTVPQAQALEKITEEGGRPIDAVINFSIGQDELMARLTGRRLCRKCGTAYHLLFAPPARDEICDRCGEKLYQREDDREATIAKRLKVYRDQTRPLIDYYSSRGLLKDIDGSGEVRVVLGRITATLGMGGK